MLGELTNEEIESILKNQLIGRIGCCADNKILVVPITYAYEDGYIYGHSKEGSKIKMMRINPSVCFEIDTLRDMRNWQSVIVWGDYEELITTETIETAIKLLTDKVLNKKTSESMPAYRMPEPHPHNATSKAIAFRIKIKERSGRFEKSF